MPYHADNSIPEPLYDALVDSDKEYGEEVKDFLKGKSYEDAISVTSLNTPPQKLHLIKRHYRDIWIDPIKDCWHSMMGNVIHWVLEKYAATKPERFIAESRMGVEVNVDGKTCYLHGKFDLYDKDEFALEDWKLTSATNMIYPKTMYELQLNVLRYIMVNNGYRVDKLKNIYLFPHLDKTKFSNPLYPQRHERTVDVPIMPMADVLEYIKSRFRIHIENKNAKDIDLTPCSDEDRWVRGTYYAIYLRKKGGKKGEKQEFSSRAAFKADTKSALFAYRKENKISKEDVFYKTFKGEAKACGFCKAASFCRQRQAELIELEQQPTNKPDPS